MVAALRKYLYGVGPPHGLCVFRILLGGYFLVFWLTHLPDIPLHFSEEGMAFPMFDPPEGPIRGLDDLLGWVARPASPAAAWCLFAFTVVLVSLFTAGLWTRPALVLYLCLFSYYYFLQIHTRDTSFDRLLFVLTALLTLGRCDAVYSVRSWLRRRRGLAGVENIPLWPGRLIALQIALMYFGAGVYKLQAEDWTRGEMLYYTLMGNWGSPRAFWIVRNFTNLGLYDLAVVGTVIMELYMPLLLFHRRWQKLVFVTGTMFHIVIADLINIWPFMFMPLAYVLFVEPHEFRRFCRLVGDRLPARRASAAMPSASPMPEPASVPLVERDSA